MGGGKVASFFGMRSIFFRGVTQFCESVFQQTHNVYKIL